MPCELAVEVSASRPSVKVGTLAQRVMFGVPIEQDFRSIDESDQIVLQDRAALSPPFTNRRATEYEEYLRRRGYVAVSAGDDLKVYSIRCDQGRQ
jgi:hypothetical protein